MLWPGQPQRACLLPPGLKGPPSRLWGVRLFWDPREQSPRTALLAEELALRAGSEDARGSVLGVGGRRLSQAVRLHAPCLPGCTGNPPGGTAPRPQRRAQPRAFRDHPSAPSPPPAEGWGRLPLGSCLDVQEVVFSPSGVLFIVDETIKSLLRYVQSTVEIQGDDAAWGEVWLPSEQGAAKPCTVPLPRFKWLETFEKGGTSSGDWKPAEVLGILSPEGGRRGRRDLRGEGHWLLELQEEGFSRGWARLLLKDFADGLDHRLLTSLLSQGS